MNKKDMPKLKRINGLTKISGLTAQMRTVYRLARSNIPDDKLDPQTAKILVDILKTIAQAHKDSELEQRIEALEEINGSN